MRAGDDLPIELAEQDGILRVIVTGQWPSVDEISEAHAMAVSTGLLTDSTLELVDIRAMNGLPPSMVEAKFLERQFTPAPRRRAFLVKSDVHYGIGRMAEVLLSSDLRVFRSEADAIAWLRSESGQDD